MKVTLLKKFLSRNLMTIMVVVLVLSQGLLFSFVYMSRQAQEYTTEVEQMAFEKGQKFTIANIPERKKQKVKSKLFSLANKNNLVLLRISSLSNDRGVQVSIYGDIQWSTDNFDYEFFGKKIFNTGELQKLLKSKNDDATLGLDQGSVNMLNDLPHFRYGGKVVINKLAAVLHDDEQIEGKYIVLGLKSDKQKNRFFKELTKVTGIDKEALSAWKEEHSSNWGNEVALPVLVAIFEILLLIAVCLVTVKELKNMGNLLLQGWSRKDFALKIYSPILIAGFISIFLFIKYGLVLALSTALKNEDYFLVMVPQMIKIGEQSGKIDEMMGKTAQVYENELDEEIRAISTAIEPILMVFLALVAALMVGAILFPIYSLVNNIHI